MSGHRDSETRGAYLARALRGPPLSRQPVSFPSHLPLARCCRFDAPDLAALAEALGAIQCDATVAAYKTYTKKWEKWCIANNYEPVFTPASGARYWQYITSLKGKEQWVRCSRVVPMGQVGEVTAWPLHGQGGRPGVSLNS